MDEYISKFVLFSFFHFYSSPPRIARSYLGVLKYCVFFGISQ